ncbi:oligosaccharide flippase family protein [bacterium]|nr:oligosaccharide flippase family protein [bacterium]
MFKITIGASSKNLLKDTSIYGAGSLINQFIPVLLLPILTRYLSPEEYGIVAIFSVVTPIMVNFIGLNLPAAIQRNYIDHTKEELSGYVGTAFFVVLLTFGIGLGISYGGKDLLFQALSLPGRWLSAILAVAFFQVIIAIIQIIWRMERKALRFVYFQILQTVINIGLSLLFVVFFLWHWQGRILGIITSAAICGLLSLYLLYKNKYLAFRFEKEYARSMLCFGVPLIFHTLSTWVINGSDRLFIVNMVGTSAVGLYSVGYAIGGIIQLLQEAFSQAWVPFLFESLKEQKEANKLQIVKLIYLHHITIIGLAFILHVSAPFVLKLLVGKHFQGASVFVLWIAAGYAVNGMYRMIVPFINYARKTHLLPIGATVAAVSNLCLNFLLIKINGPIGAAQATFFSFLIFYLITLFFCLNVYKMPWLFWRYSKSGSAL